MTEKGSRQGPEGAQAAAQAPVDTQAASGGVGEAASVAAPAVADSASAVSASAEGGAVDAGAEVGAVGDSHRLQRTADAVRELRDRVVAAPGAGAAAGSAEATSSAGAAGNAGRRGAREEEFDDDAVAAELRGGRRWGRWAVLSVLVALALGAGAAVLLGRWNSQRYVLRCDAERVVAERGRAFPPWGERALEGKPWKPIALALSAECVDRETRSEPELTSWYLTMLMEQAAAKLSARKVVEVDAAAAQLEQAAFLARDPERREQRALLEQLRGDVEYWRAVAKLTSARDALTEAAKLLEEAAQKKPRYATDAAARAVRLRRLVVELGASFAAEASDPAGTAPLGVPPLVVPGAAPSQPLAPPQITPSPSAGAPSSSQPPALPQLPPSQPPAAPSGGPDAGVPASDAGVPVGGVLL